MSYKADWMAAGFFTGSTDVDTAVSRLEDHLATMTALFRGFTEEQLTTRPVPGKWSRQEILGHLIDSAINNLKRFTEIQFLPQPYKVISYQQKELVTVNYYQQLPLTHLLELWKALNQQIIYVVKNIPGEKLDYPVDPQYDNNEIKSLGWVICDYVAHMEHHMKQLQ